jgi:DUF4097 and DUF4098 domain-containing protein YvlB
MRRRALLAGAATAATATLAGCAGGLFENRVQETRSDEFDLPAATPVRVTTENGDVTVETGDRANVAVDVTVRAPNEDRLDDVSVATSTVEGALAVEVSVAGSTSNVSVDLDAEVPEGTAMRVVQSRNGTVEVRGVAAVEAARSSNGDVSVRDAGPVESVTTENGDVAADVPAPLVGDVLLRTENGSVDAAVSTDVEAMVDARTENGNVSVSGLDLADADVSETGVTGTLGAGDHDLTAAATNGDVTLAALDE